MAQRDSKALSLLAHRVVGDAERGREHTRCRRDVRADCLIAERGDADGNNLSERRDDVDDGAHGRVEYRAIWFRLGGRCDDRLFMFLFGGCVGGCVCRSLDREVVDVVASHDGGLLC